MFIMIDIKYVFIMVIIKNLIDQYPVEDTRESINYFENC